MWRKAFFKGFFAAVLLVLATMDSALPWSWSTSSSTSSTSSNFSYSFDYQYYPPNLKVTTLDYLIVRNSGSGAANIELKNNKGYWQLSGPIPGDDNPFSISWYGKKPQDHYPNILTLTDDGRVGIGTDHPDHMLHIRGDGQTFIKIEANDDEPAGIGFFEGDDRRWVLVNDADEGDRFRICNQEFNDMLTVDQTGNVGIGRSHPENKLDVAGRIRADDIIVTGSVGIGASIPENKLDVAGTIRAYEIIVAADWPDYVFQKGYERRSLSDLERHIKENGHLPGIPTAAEVERSGIRLGEFQSKLLEKIEELTLHVIDQKKEIDRLKKEIAGLKVNAH